MKFNEKLIEIRKKQGLSQEELGMELQVSRQTISKWETGNTYTDTEELDTYFSAEQDDNGYMFYSLAAGNGPVTAGVQIEAGRYGIYTIDEKAVVVVTSKDGTKKERYPLKTGDDTLLVMLDEGDTIEVQSEDDPNACIYLMEWVN